MIDEPTKPISEGGNMAVETTSVNPEIENIAAQEDDAPASEEEAAAHLGDFA